MNEKILLDKDYAFVDYNAEQKLGRIIWKREPDASEYKIAYLTMLNFASAEDMRYLLSDIRDQGSGLPNERKWFEQELLPAINKTRLKKAAVVYDGTFSKKYYVNLIIAAGKKFGLSIKLFENEENAVSWLVSTSEEKEITEKTVKVL
ncbi:MAG: hypothetical protein EA361_06255 [Bacteroidetes bacterium]|nr:MAG: hypothetical protein EA361_06255 [Bacteroidota bacterium]